MAVKRGVRLQCQETECKCINYITRKNAKSNPDRLSLNKFCSTCRKVTSHIEIKKK
ncbi:50S ribosomal protein L33 [Ureaplasma canigenitalium]|uniref:50S ribosomal protein L33 n=1 Tax=Ureaplasma canigenitalium TaxID=42092 RepID=UPI0004E1D806|nr:50S ribosomal protein L33 [Ureaplasma canigenitalium]